MLNITPNRARILAVLLGSAAAAVFLTGCSGGDDSSNTAGTSGGKSKTTSAGGDDTSDTSGSSGGSGPRTAGSGGGGGAPSPMGSGGMGSGGFGGMGGGQQAAISTPKPKNTATAPGFRSDPLRPWWDTTPKPPSVFTYVEPVRIAIANSAAEEKPEGVDIQEVPNRRVAGILTGNGVYALIDDFAGKAEVVKPGQVLDDGYRVASINANAVILKKVIDNRTYTQTVPLTDAGSTQFAAPAMNMGGMRGSGGATSGGRMPGSGGMGSGGRMSGRRGGNAD